MVAAPDDVLRGLSGDVLFVGNGCAAHRARLAAWTGGIARFAPIMQPALAETIGRLASARVAGGERPSPDAIAPLYVRRPDPELARDARPHT